MIGLQYVKFWLTHFLTIPYKHKGRRIQQDEENIFKSKNLPKQTMSQLSNIPILLDEPTDRGTL